MEGKPTPGPWRTDEAEHDMPYQHIRIYDGIFHVCTVPIDDAPVHDYNAKQRANARRIAAAPEMLKALRKAAAAFATISASNGATRDAEAAIKAAITKAEGRSE